MNVSLGIFGKLPVRFIFPVPFTVTAWSFYRKEKNKKEVSQFIIEECLGKQINVDLPRHMISKKRRNINRQPGARDSAQGKDF